MWLRETLLGEMANKRAFPLTLGKIDTVKYRHTVGSHFKLSHSSTFVVVTNLLMLTLKEEEIAMCILINVKNGIDYVPRNELNIYSSKKI